MNVCCVGVMMILPLTLILDTFVNVCFLIKWHSVFKTKIGLIYPSPCSESVFSNHLQESSAFFPLLQKNSNANPQPRSHNTSLPCCPCSPSSSICSLAVQQLYYEKVYSHMLLILHCLITYSCGL